MVVAALSASFIWAADSNEESAAETLAKKIAESTGSQASHYLDYARRLVKTLQQFTSNQRSDAIGVAYERQPLLPRLGVEEGDRNAARVGVDHLRALADERS